MSLLSLQSSLRKHEALPVKKVVHAKCANEKILLTCTSVQINQSFACHCVHFSGSIDTPWDQQRLFSNCTDNEVPLCCHWAQSQKALFECKDYIQAPLNVNKISPKYFSLK